MVYENQIGALAAGKDRKDQWFPYFYDGGRISDVRLGSRETRIRPPNPPARRT